LEVGMTDDRVQQMISIGTPVDKYDFAFLESCNKPLLLVHGEHDEFGSVPRLQELVTAIQRHNPSVELHIIEGAGHFFEGQLDELKQVVTDWIRKRLEI
jgi:Predicted hydrolase of the alpha/beta superfamily